MAAVRVPDPAARRVRRGGSVALTFDADMTTGMRAALRSGQVLRALGWLAYLAAPFTGVPVAAAWVGRKLDSRLDTGAFGLLVVGGLIARCALATLLT